MRHIPLYLSFALAALLVSSACMRVGPDYHRPDTGIDTPPSYQHSPADGVTQEPEDRWWEVFGDPELSTLVEEVLTNNLDIKKATAKILQVRAQLVQTRADRFPNLSIQAKGERRRRPEGISIPGQTLSSDRESTTYD
ncbi:MAG: TolC family protein, partial [Deltaproteobacteria bacterium]|nr:TolC family protein [Deltaproteobacteria bacterium]